MSQPKIFDTVIIGAGIVGLATAYQLLKLRPSWKVLVIEKETGPAMHQSGRNSGVIHTGVYYKTGSLKAKNCVKGRSELLRFCDEKGVPYQKIHKLIVATQKEELPRLHEIQARGQSNGVPGLQILSKEQIQEIEPHVSALEALYVPECHIVEFSKVAKALCQWIQDQGGTIVFKEAVQRLEKQGDLCSVETLAQSYLCRVAINCAGLYSDHLAHSYFGRMDARIIPFRGEYYQISEEKQHLVRGLIYPVPDPKFPFLGVHLTPMMNGKIEAGPNAILALAREGYGKMDVNLKELMGLLGYEGFWKMAFKYWKTGLYEVYRSLSKTIFLRDLQRLVPEIEMKDLTPGHRGIRAQVVKKDGTMADDFMILGEGPSLHVINAPSPAATASFAIGRTIVERVKV